MTDLNAFEQSYKNGFKAGQQEMLNRIIMFLMDKDDYSADVKLSTLYDFLKVNRQVDN